MSDEEDPLVVACRERVGQMLGKKWRLDALIGVGGMAAVYASTHRNGARAAIKVLHQEFAGHAEVRARFLREAYIANKVEHPGTVQVLDDDVSDNGEPYIVMELLPGESVETRAARNGGWLKYPEVLNIVEQTLAVLEKAHAAGIVHRDLKPDNLFLTTKGQVKVLDFGIARLHDAASSSKRTQEGMAMGTPAFMAPEQALGKWNQVDGRTDLWAVGSILFTLLSGKPVHEAQTDNEMLIRAATRPAPSLGRVVPKAPLELVRVVDRALAFEQAKRFPDATAMRAAVRALMAAARAVPFGEQAPPSLPPPPSTSEPPGGVPSTRAAVSAAPAPTIIASTSASVAPQSGRAPAVAPLQPTRDQVGVTGPPPSRASAQVAAHGATISVDAVPAVPGGSGTAVVPFAPAAEPGVTQIVEAHPRAKRGEGFDPAYASAEDLASMKDFFTELERAIIARTQYGSEHPETRRRADKTFKVCASALMHSEYGLAWNVTPYSFTAGETTLWEPTAPLDRIPYQLFADGVRLLGLTPGIDEPEFQGFVRILTLDRAGDVAPEDDFATLIWDADFQHVVHQIIDNFADGDQAQRQQFETDRQDVLALVHADTTEQLVDCWKENRGKSDQPVARVQRRLVSRFTSGSQDVESLARAAELRVAEGTGGATVDPAVLRVDDAVRTMLGARLSMDTSGLDERFVYAVARAYEDSIEQDGGGPVTTPLRFAVDGIAKKAPEMAIDMVGAFCREVGSRLPAEEGESKRAKFAAAIVSPKMVASVLEGVKVDGADRAVYAKGLRTILGYCDATYFSVVLQHIGEMPTSELRDVLVDYLARTGVGHEAELGGLFADADLELGLAIVRVLAAIRTPAAREAISHATRSPHPVVRIEALGHVEGVSSERLRLELRALLEDLEPGVRIAALKAMEQYNIRVAGPFLVLRVRSSGFDGLPIEERRQALSTLATLAANRAESVALEILKDRSLVASGEHEATRELAAQLVGRIGVSQEAHDLLAELSTARFRNSEKVRAAAGSALESFVSRMTSGKLAGAAAPVARAASGEKRP